MLSTSTLSSTAMSASSNGTPPPHAAMTKRTASNPLTDLIDTEKNYLDTLKIIDSQIAAIWMKQTLSAAPDFSELLKYAHDILKVNKHFCMKLVKISANPQTIQELGSVLMQWVDDMEVPYANYARRYIPNLNQRQEIASNMSIQHLLQNLSANVAQELSLESLFDAPLHQLQYYKNMYNRLLESTDPGKADHNLLQNANTRINTILRITNTGASNSPPRTEKSKTPLLALPRIQTDFDPPGKSSCDAELMAIDRQADCTRVVDMFSGIPTRYRLRLATPGARLILRSHFWLLSEDPSAPIRVQLVLTTDQLAIFKEQTKLMYPTLAISDVNVRSTKLDREIAGEFLMQFAMMGKKHMTMRAESREARNAWVGVDSSAPSSTTLMIRPLANVIRAQFHSSSKVSPGQPTPQSASDKAQAEEHIHAVKSKLRSDDIFSYYSDKNGEISPLESSDEERYPPPVPSVYTNLKETVSLPLSGNEDHEDLSTIQPRSVKILSKLPPVEADRAHVLPSPLTEQPRKDSPLTQNKASQETSQVQMTFIEPAMAKMTISTSQHPLENDDNGSQPPPTPSKHALPVLQQVPVRYDSVRREPNGPPRPAELPHSEIAHSLSTDRPPPSPAGPPRHDSDPNALPRSASKPMTPNPVPAALPRTASANTPEHQPSLRPQPNPAYFAAQRNQQPRPPPSPQQPYIHPHPSQPSPSYQHPHPYSQAHSNPHPHAMQSQPPWQPYSGPQYPPGHPLQRPPPMQQQQHQQQQQGYHGHFRPSSPHQSSAYPHRPAPVPGRPPLQASYSSTTAQSRSYPSPTPSRSALPGGSNSHLNHGPSTPRGLTLGDAYDPHTQQPSLSMGGPDGASHQVPFSNNQCEVFRWNNGEQTWNFVDGKCTLQVRQTADQRSSMTVQLQGTGQLYLNAWIMPNMAISQPLATDVCVGVYMPEKETYLVHFVRPEDAEAFMAVLQRLRDQAQQPVTYLPSRTSSRRDEEELPPRTVEDGPQTLSKVLQCKCKLFAQNETSHWSHLGSVVMVISQQLPSKKFHIHMEKGKNDLVSAFVKSDNVEHLGTKQITFLLKNEQERTSMVYMIQVKDKQTKDQIYKYLKQKNAEFGW